MGALAEAQPLDVGGPISRRAAARTNANWFRALAWRALRDGTPQAALRAANARAAARIVLRQAKRDRLLEASDAAAQAGLRCSERHRHAPERAGQA